MKPKLSSRNLDRLLLSLRNQNSIPASIWPLADSPRDRPLPPPAAVPPPPPPLKLSHPLLRALESSGGASTSRFSQSLAQLLVSGLARHRLAAGRAIKLLCSSSSSSVYLAVHLFTLVDDPDAFLLNTILRAFLLFRRPKHAFAFLYLHGRPSLVPPNHFTFTLLAKLFAELDLAEEGLSVHAHVVKLGLDDDLYVLNAFIHMYCRFGVVCAARKLFDSCCELDLVSWNSIIDGYVKNKMMEAARELFDVMPERDAVSWNVMIAGHAGLGVMDAAKHFFLAMPEKDVVSWNSMIDGYARIGNVGAAREHFDAMPERNVVSWNIILALYARINNYRECLRLFDTMIAVGDVKPNEASFVSVLTACGNLGELDRGKWIHSLIREKFKSIKPDVLLSTALLTMYTKCGVMEAAKKIFYSMEEQSIVTWNSMIMGYGLHGQGGKALELFLKMERSGPRPNETTFVCLLSSCAHNRMVLEGWWCFDRLIHFYGLKPNAEHLGCMMDLLGRAGLLKELEDLVKRMSTTESPALWCALMSASTNHCNWKLGEFIGRKLIDTKPTDIGPYVLLSNIYASEGRWDDVEKVRETIEENELQKAAGLSLVRTDESGSPNTGKVEGSDSKKSMMFNMLREMGSHWKLSCRGLCNRKNTSVCTA